jgi:hypothetical protein
MGEEMLEVRLLGGFEEKQNNKSVVIKSRSA